MTRSIRGLTLVVVVVVASGCSGRERERQEVRGPTVGIERAAGGEPDAGQEVSGTSERERGEEPTVAREGPSELTWSYPGTKLGRIDVVVSVPDQAVGEGPFPVLVALHGMGEAMKAPRAGARGWLDDYELPTAIRRLRDPPLAEADFHGLVTDARLRDLNASLEARPFRGLIVVCPFTPRRIADDRTGGALRWFGELIVDEVLPRVRRETPASTSPAGIDGVSFGGRIALRTGLRWPEVFGAVASIQAAFVPGEVGWMASAARAAHARNPRQRLRLLSSNGDGFLPVNLALSRELERLGVEHEMLVVPGPHDYVFNRGPGALEMLIFHDRVLRGEGP
jgi:pimeloyl-ACP methyl ester carboxylesterase